MLVLVALTANATHKLWLRGVGSGGNPTHIYELSNGRLEMRLPDEYLPVPGSHELMRGCQGRANRTAAVSLSISPSPLRKRNVRNFCLNAVLANFENMRRWDVAALAS